MVEIMDLLERPRRNRKSPWVRSMARENHVARNTSFTRCLSTAARGDSPSVRCLDVTGFVLTVS